MLGAALVMTEIIKLYPEHKFGLQASNDQISDDCMSDDHTRDGWISNRTSSHSLHIRWFVKHTLFTRDGWIRR
jgi:hypothetical protein